MEGHRLMSDIGVDYELVRLLRERVADEMTRAKQHREARGERELSDSGRAPVGDERDHRPRCSGIWRAAGRRRGIARRRRVRPEADPWPWIRRMYEAGEFQELLDDPDVENIDINGCDEVFVTYADGRGKVRGRPIAATDDDLIQIVQNLRRLRRMNARPFTRANPELDLRLPDGSRLSAVMARRGAAGGVDPPEPVPADVPGHPGRAGHDRRPAGVFPAGRGAGPDEHRGGGRDRRGKDHPAQSA